MKTLKIWSSFALLASALCFNPPASAQNLSIDFETQPPVTSTDKLEISKTDLKITITRPQGTFSIATPPDVAFGNHALLHNPNAIAPLFIVDFSEPVKNISFDIGHTIPGLVTLFVSAYDDNHALGTVLETVTLECCDGAGFRAKTVTLLKPGIKSISFNTGFLFSSVYYDNFTFTPDKKVIDLDLDGIADDEDGCLDSDLGPTVVIDGCDSTVANVTWYRTGCTTSDYVTACEYNAIDHGGFVSCVNEFINSVEHKGFLTQGEKGRLNNCVARAKLP